MDSTTKVQHYVERAKECGMKALAFAEHGNVFEWTHKKRSIEAAGMKYIHASEVYVTETLDKKVRDNYHFVLIAKNSNGVEELNHLLSHEVASNRDDGHFYYVPRITLDELFNTSDDIIITTACLGTILHNGSIELQKEFIKFALNNKDRVFLEIQHHNVEDQINYNKKLYQISKRTGLRLIAGTDTHSLNELHAKSRIVLQRAKNTYFANEEGWDLTFKTYDELVSAYRKQDSLPMEVVLQAIENTNVVADMVEEFELDTSFKYPDLYDNPEKLFMEKIKKGLNKKKAQLTPEVAERIKREVKVYRDLGVIDYILLENELKAYCREVGIPYGYGRGSVTGSYIAYLLEVTHMDSIRHNLIFERFLNPERVTIAD